MKNDNAKKNTVPRSTKKYRYNKTLEIGCTTQRLLEVCTPANAGDVYVVSGSSPGAGDKPVLGIVYRATSGDIMFRPSKKTAKSVPAQFLMENEPYSSMAWCAGSVSYSSTPDIDEMDAFLLTLAKKNVFANTPSC